MPKIKVRSFNTSISRPQAKGTAFGLKIIFFILILAGMAIGLKSLLSRPIYENLQQSPQVFAATSDPSELSIPSLKITAAFEPLGLKKDNTIQVPKDYGKVGWYVFGAKPGDNGPFVAVGHLDSPTGPAVFANLKNIKIGDQITAKLADGSIVEYKVDLVEKFLQDNFPTQAVYGKSSQPVLRLITCSGTWSKSRQRYSENLVVFASQVQ